MPPPVKNIDVYAILKRFNQIIKVIVSSKSLDLLNQQKLIPKNTNETKKSDCIFLLVKFCGHVRRLFFASFHITY